MNFSKMFRRYPGHEVRCCLFVLWATFFGMGWGAHGAAAQARKAAAPARRPPMTRADVEKRWKDADDTLLANDIRLRGLGFTPSGYWLKVELPTATGVAPARMASSAAALRHLIPAPPDLDEVTSQAPALLNSLKAAAQKRNESEMQPLVDASLMANKASIYDVFDTSSFRAGLPGKASQDDDGDVGLPYFELTTSNVEKLYYVLFSRPKGKLIIQDVITGPAVADLYLHDEEKLANTKLETMFRALNDGDQAGVKELCTPGLFEAIQAWGGQKHPGDRLTRGRRLNQVTVQTSVPLDQKSIRVVTKVSYPLTASTPVVFFIDFERIGNELKIVRLRDSENKVIVYDPNIDNYLNRRYSLPDGPVLTDVAMTEEAPFLSFDQVKSGAVRHLQYHDQAKIIEDATNLVESDPTNGTGYGVRAAVELMKRNVDAADKDALKALELNGTVYFLLARHSLTSAKPFTLALLGVSKTRIDYLPAPGTGGPEVIDLQSAQASFEKPLPFLRVARPFLKLEFKGSDGKKKTYNFADFGTACPSDNATPLAKDLVSEPAGTVCLSMAAAAGSKDPRTQGPPVLTPQAWREDLTVVITAVNAAKNNSHK